MGISPIEKAILVIDSFGKSAEKRGLLQNLAPQSKIFAAAFFIITVVSFGKYDTMALTPYIPMLSFLTASSGVSFKSMFLRILAVSPFVIFIGVFNPLFDPARVAIFGRDISAGWLSFASIMIKFLLTVWCSLLLISTTKFQAVVSGLKLFKIPAVLANQFYFIFRYLRLLLKEALVLQRSRQARLGAEGEFGVRIFAGLAGTLAVRSVRRSSNIHDAMIARGFNGNIPETSAVRKFGAHDAILLISVIFCCVFFRFIYIFQISL